MVLIRIIVDKTVKVDQVFRSESTICDFIEKKVRFGI